MAEAKTRHAVQCSSIHFPLADISAIMEEAQTRHAVQLMFCPADTKSTAVWNMGGPSNAFLSHVTQPSLFCLLPVLVKPVCC